MLDEIFVYAYMIYYTVFPYVIYTVSLLYRSLAFELPVFFVTVVFLHLCCIENFHYFHFSNSAEKNIFSAQYMAWSKMTCNMCTIGTIVFYFSYISGTFKFSKSMLCQTIQSILLICVMYIYMYIMIRTMWIWMTFVVLNCIFL